MLSPRVARAKAAIKASVPFVSTAYRALRQISGRDGAGDRRALTDYIRRHTSSQVASGPFSGMRLMEGASWGDGDVAPKLLGTYEQELHDSIERCRGRNYDAVVDLGCAEGYYAVGLARLFPTLPVYAFDTDRIALGLARRAAEANGAADRIAFAGFCDRAQLSDLSTRHARLLVFSDCEGHEVELFGPNQRGDLSRSDLIVECHDEIRPGGTEAMAEALAATHVVHRIDAIGRNPNRFPFLVGIHERDRWLAVCENRPYCSHWLAFESRLTS